MLIITALALIVPSLAGAVDDDTVLEPASNTRFERTIGEDPELELIGVAARSRYFIKIYGVGLYAQRDALERKLGDEPVTEVRLAAAIIAMNGRRALVLKMVRDVGADRMRNAFREGIELSISIDDERITVEANAFIALIPDATEGQTFMMVIDGDGTINGFVDGMHIGTVKNWHLARALLKIYIGINPIDEAIKSGLLSLYEG